MTHRIEGRNNRLHINGRMLTILAMSTALYIGAFPAVISVQRATAQSMGTHSFNIPAQPLNRALRALSDQSGIQIAYQTSIASGAMAPALTGTMTSEQALQRLLSNSGLNYSFTNANTVTISNTTMPTSVQGAPFDAGDTTLLDTITVSSGIGAALSDAPYQTAGSVNYISEQDMATS
jgi:hypothetical protein